MDLLSIPDDLLVLILSFFNANEIESYVKTTCKTLCVRVTQSMSLWRLLCLRTGKLPSNNGSKAVSCQYRDLYLETICVPVDRPSIQEALDDILQKPRPVTIITLMPGVHRERVEFDICSQHLPIVCDEAVRFCIRAAFPERGASLVYCGQKSSDDEHPCVQLTTIGNDLRNRGYIHLELEHLTLLHYTKGNNIWRGNTCVRVDGSNTLLSMKSCTVQSDSGRGIGKNQLSLCKRVRDIKQLQSKITHNSKIVQLSQEVRHYICETRLYTIVLQLASTLVIGALSVLFNLRTFSEMDLALASQILWSKEMIHLLICRVHIW